MQTYNGYLEMKNQNNGMILLYIGQLENDDRKSESLEALKRIHCVDTIFTMFTINLESLENLFSMKFRDKKFHYGTTYILLPETILKLR